MGDRATWEIDVGDASADSGCESARAGHVGRDRGDAARRRATRPPPRSALWLPRPSTCPHVPCRRLSGTLSGNSAKRIPPRRRQAPLRRGRGSQPLPPHPARHQGQEGQKPGSRRLQDRGARPGLAEGQQRPAGKQEHQALWRRHGPEPPLPRQDENPQERRSRHQAAGAAAGGPVRRQDGRRKTWV